jgi:hypothetical protein
MKIIYPVVILTTIICSLHIGNMPMLFLTLLSDNFISPVKRESNYLIIQCMTTLTLF